MNHFKDVLHSQSRSMVPAKLNVTQQKQICTKKPENIIAQNKYKN